jgi:predicted TIM-barrel fold metal-dependent hydrolase
MSIQHPIIDIDTHFTEPKDLWTSRAPEKYRDRVLEVRREGKREAWFIGDHRLAAVGPGVVRADGSKERGVISLDSMEEMSPAGTLVKPRLEMMDQHQIRAAIIYPNVIGFGATRLMELGEDPDLRLFHVHAYNDHISEMQAESGNRLFPQAALPLWDMDATLAEVTRCREKLGLTGLVMSDRPEDFGQPSLADPAWDRFFATCQDLELPVNFHIASGNEPAIPAGFWGDRELRRGDGNRLNSAMACYMSVSLFMANFRDVVNLILTGVLDRYPRLNFVSVESGVSWIPFVLQSLEYTFDELMTPQDRAAFKRRPTEYFRDQIYTSYWFENKRAVQFYIDEIGADNLMFETDFPHPQSLYPGVRAKVDETLGGYDDSVQRKVLYETASKLYGIPID